MSDIIIDFYLLYTISELIPTVIKDTTYLFSSFFCKRLMSVPGNTVMVARQRYELVKNWTKKSNIFDKEFILIPINVK